MTDVTDADGDKALDIIGEHGHGDPDPFGEIADAIAAALAEERNKARAPFLAAREAILEVADQTIEQERRLGLLAAAHLIDQAAQQTTTREESA